MWAQTGTELRALADAFATSHQRQELRCKAQQTDLKDISWDRFRQLLEELFSVGSAGRHVRRHSLSHVYRHVDIRVGSTIDMLLIVVMLSWFCDMCFECVLLV